MPGRYILCFLGIGISFSCINIVFLSLYNIFIIVRDSHVSPIPLTYPLNFNFFGGWAIFMTFNIP
jgi:hypothetical protein